MRTVLDTSVVIARDVVPHPGEAAISAITVAELQYGVLVARNSTARAERLRRLVVVQRVFDPLPVDDAVATSYGLVAAAVVEAGRTPRARAMDLLIAATAHAHGAALLTRNASDLVGLEGLLDIREP